MMLAGKPRICLVEPHPTHAEVLYPLIELLRGDFEVHVIAPRSLLDIDLLSTTRHLYTQWPLEEAYHPSSWRSLPGLVRKYRDIRRMVALIQPVFILFNSTYRRVERALIAALLRRSAKGQVIHEFHQFLGVGGHWLYDRFDLSLVISEQVFNHVSTHHREFAGLDYVLPIYFQGFLEILGGSPRSATEDGTVKLGVFGNIDDWRRNYRGLLDALSQTTAGSSDHRFEVYLVGQEPAWLHDEIERRGLGRWIRTYPKFVPFERMFELLRHVDLVLFLIDSSVANCRYYNRYQISGTSTLVRAFGKAAASSTDFLVDESLERRCFFYEGTDVKSLLDLIDRGELTVRTIEDKLASSGDLAPPDFERQREKLVALVRAAARR